MIKTHSIFLKSGNKEFLLYKVFTIKNFER